MVSIAGVIKTQIAFFIGFIIVYIMQFLLPILEDLMTDFGFTTLNGVYWFFGILIYVLGLIVIPVVLMIKALGEEDDIDRSVIVIMGILMFILNLYLTYRGYFVVQAMAGMMEGTFVLAVFWIGALMSWVLSTIVAPFYMVTKGVTKSG